MKSFLILLALSMTFSGSLFASTVMKPAPGLYQVDCEDSIFELGRNICTRPIDKYFDSAIIEAVCENAECSSLHFERLGKKISDSFSQGQIIDSNDSALSDLNKKFAIRAADKRASSDQTYEGMTSFSPEELQALVEHFGLK